MNFFSPPSHPCLPFLRPPTFSSASHSIFLPSSQCSTNWLFRSLRTPPPPPAGPSPAAGLLCKRFLFLPYHNRCNSMPLREVHYYDFSSSSFSSILLREHPLNEERDKSAPSPLQPEAPFPKNSPSALMTSDLTFRHSHQLLRKESRQCHYNQPK